MAHRLSRLVYSLVWVVCVSSLVLVPKTINAKAPPADHLIGPDVVGFISAADVPEMAKKWDQTQLGLLLADPKMKPFVDHVKEVIRNEWADTRTKLGLTWDDIEKLPSGEGAIAINPNAEGKPVTTIFLDVTKHLDEVNKVMAKTGAALIKEGAKKRIEEVGNVPMTIYDLPKDKKEIDRGLVLYFVKDDLLVITDDVKVATEIVGRWDGKKTSLATLPEYLKLNARCEKDAKGLKPDVHWFARPIQLAQTLEAGKPEEKKRSVTDEPDALTVLQESGFDQITGAAGYHNFVEGQFDTLYRVAVAAMPPYKMGMRMLQFPNGGDHKPPTWIPEDVSNFTHFNWLAKEAFEGFAYLFDAYMEEKGGFEDLIEQVRDDPNGNKIDMRVDLAGHLGGRALMLSDYELPIKPSSSRAILAVETTNPMMLEKNIGIETKRDKSVKKTQFLNYTVFEVSNQNQTPPVPGAGPNVINTPKSALCVAHGHLLIATHVDLMHKILRERNALASLAPKVEYRLVDRALNTLVDSPECARGFIRTADSFLPTFELIKQGKLYKDESLVGTVLRALIREDDRKQKIDGTLLPTFDVVRRYLGPAGWSARSEDDGWFMVGFSLKR